MMTVMMVMMVMMTVMMVMMVMVVGLALTVHADQTQKENDRIKQQEIDDADQKSPDRNSCGQIEACLYDVKLLDEGCSDIRECVRGVVEEKRDLQDGKGQRARENSFCMVFEKIPHQ